MHAGPLLPSEAVQLAGVHDDARRAGTPTAAIGTGHGPTPGGAA
jgi:hypothetical protein